MREIVSGGVGIRLDEAIIDIEDGGGEQIGWKFRVGRLAEKARSCGGDSADGGKKRIDISGRYLELLEELQGKGAGL